MDTQRTHRPRFDLTRILVIDLEATCWKGPPPPGEDHEIIEIGNAVLHVGDLHVEPGPEIMLKPTGSSVSPFCTELTRITQEMLDERGLPFPEAIAALEAAHGGLRAVVWASYGGYDRRMLLAECERHGVDFPLSDTHLNVKRLVALMGGWTRETGMMRAMRRLGLEPTPGATHHRGCDDAIEIGRILGLAMREARRRLGTGLAPRATRKAGSGSFAYGRIIPQPMAALRGSSGEGVSQHLNVHGCRMRDGSHQLSRLRCRQGDRLGLLEQHLQFANTG